MIQHRVIQVYGHVQGVFFRQSTRQTAHELGLTGYARNEADGSVAIEAEGPEEGLDALVLWCHQGPPAARVEKVTVQHGPVQGYAAFEVQR